MEHDDHLQCIQLAERYIWSDKLRSWAKIHGRHDLPWQKRHRAYHVWISEIMLQQTQVVTVIPYYKKFMRRFPSIKQLAAAEINEVLILWAGLGYYRRAHYLHRTAKIIQADYRGRFPRQLEQMMQLPGIGRTTAGAIISLGQRQYAPILDGNVKRVLTRVYAIDHPVTKGDTERLLWRLAAIQTPEPYAPQHNQAIMDLGALICTPTQPQCQVCPLKRHCKACRQNNPLDYPVKAPRKNKARREQQVHWLLMLTPDQNLSLSIQNNGKAHLPANYKYTMTDDLIHLLSQLCSLQAIDCNQLALLQTRLLKNKSLRQECITYLLAHSSHYLEQQLIQGIWPGLYAFPMCALTQDAIQYAAKQYHFKVKKTLQLPTIRHRFTHFDWVAHPVILIGRTTKTTCQEKSGHWYQHSINPCLGGMPSPMIKLFENLNK